MRAYGLKLGLKPTRSGSTRLRSIRTEIDALTGSANIAAERERAVSPEIA
jgi:hypothetical protein